MSRSTDLSWKPMRVVLRAVGTERYRQESLVDSGKFAMTCADDPNLHRSMSVLMEEVGEAARAVLEGDRDNLREELVQVAAVAVAIVEAIDTGRVLSGEGR